jgi:hypothetical protein
LKKEKRIKQCPICKGETKELHHGPIVEIACYNCNAAAPIIVGYYHKKRKKDERR